MYIDVHLLQYLLKWLSLLHGFCTLVKNQPGLRGYIFELCSVALISVSMLWPIPLWITVALYNKSLT